VHSPTIVELPNRDLLVAWYQGSGERRADDVSIMGARLKAGAKEWSSPFVMADVPDFPDINPILFIDPRGRLWLMWYTVIANQWETSLLRYRISDDYVMQEGPPRWTWQDVLHVKPGGPTEGGIQPDDRFVESVERQIEQYTSYIMRAAGPIGQKLAGKMAAMWRAELLAKAKGEDMMRKGYVLDSKGGRREQSMGYPYFRRMGWQTKNKPAIVDGKRMIVPLYSDGFSFSLMAVTDDCGETWQFSEPLVAPGNIQASIVEKADGSLVAYMRDNGPPPNRLHVSSSTDDGLKWSPVTDSELPNPGSGADLATLENGHWIIVYNDTEQGRHSLAASVSTDEGKSWEYTRHLERDLREREAATRSHYPAVIEGHDGTVHVVYSYHRNDRKDGPNKTIKYARFSEAWVMESDGASCGAPAARVRWDGGGQE
jgi:predicted neuraminidase